VAEIALDRVQPVDELALAGGSLTEPGIEILRPRRGDGGLVARLVPLLDRVAQLRLQHGDADGGRVPHRLAVGAAMHRCFTGEFIGDSSVFIGGDEHKDTPVIVVTGPERPTLDT
jgi:hypothetical protein